MYNKINGERVVFDAMPKNESGSSFTGFVETWLADMNTAVEADRAKRAQTPPLVRSNAGKLLGGLPVLSKSNSLPGVK